MPNRQKISYSLEKLSATRLSHERSSRSILLVEDSMKTLLLISATLGVLSFTGCTRNEPGTFGQGNAGVPGTVATGAPAEAEKGTNRIPSNADATAYERSSSTFEDRSTTNAPAPATNSVSQ